MKVLIANKFHHRRGGAETAAFNLADLLKAHGHEVIAFSMRHPDNEPVPNEGDFVSRVEFRARAGPRGALRAAARIIYSREARRKLDRLLERERPDVAHLHNIYHHLSPSILFALGRHGVPTVMTLHDYKVVCPAYTLLSHGRMCDECRGGRYLHAVRRRCGMGGAAGSLVLAAEMILHHRLLRSFERVDLFLSPSRFLAEKVAAMGFRGEVRVMPNVFFPDRHVPRFDGDGPRIIYAGRLSAEKGLLTLLEAMRGLDAKLEIIGSGPQAGELERAAADRGLANVSFPGRLAPAHLADRIRRAMFVVVPSEWPENLPYAVLEAFALGKPVVAARIGGLPELVRDGETGATFAPGDAADLRARLQTLLRDGGTVRRLGERARREAESRFHPDEAYSRLMEVYADAAAKARSRAEGRRR